MEHKDGFTRADLAAQALTATEQHGKIVVAPKAAPKPRTRAAAK